MIPDETDPEHACRTYDEFTDLTDAPRLGLNTGALKFEFFRQCMRGQARRHWDGVLGEIGAGRTNADFDQAVMMWFAKYMEPTAFHDQKQYLLTAIKPFGMTVKETVS